MKTKKAAVAAGVILMLTFGGTPAGGQIPDLLKGLQKSIAGSGPSLPDATIADGLKEALAVGAVNAVGTVSRQNGYFGNPQIRIPLPGPVEKVAPALRAVGLGERMDALDLSMNRAAEKAAPMARDIFIDAIKQMSFEDARAILGGPENAATLYLEKQTGATLSAAFQPIVRDSMAAVGVTRAYQDLQAKASAVPFGAVAGFDLDRYVTEQSLEGLFFMLGQEERRIRQDPSARATDLLRQVFGSSGK